MPTLLFASTLLFGLTAAGVCQQLWQEVALSQGCSLEPSQINEH